MLHCGGQPGASAVKGLTNERAPATLGACMAFSRIEDAVADLAAGRFVILAEAESGESQLCMAADLVTADAVNFMASTVAASSA